MQFSFSLNLKLILMILFLQLILFLTLLFLYPQSEQKLLKEVEKHAKELTTAIQATVEETTRTDSIDIAHLNEYLSSLKIKGVKEVSIIDNANRIVASSNSLNIGHVLAEEEKMTIAEAQPSPKEEKVLSLFSEEAGDTYNIILPVVARDIRFGYIQLNIDREEFSRFLREIYVRRVTAMAFVFFIGIIIAGILSRHYTRPLKELANSAMRVAEGDLNQRVEINSRDEIGRLSESFNYMIERLRKGRSLEERLRETEHLAGLGQLSRNVAHEIRNPLNFINLSIAHIDEKYRPAETERQGQFDLLVEGIKLEIQRLNRLVNDFLDYSKPIKLNIQKTDVGHVLDDSLNLVRAKAEADGVAIVKEYGTGQELNIDKDLMKSCILNIFSNAFHAMERAREKVLTIRAEKAGNDFVLSIKDTGVGVQAENLSKVFEPFFTTKPGGLGLGLAITKRVIEEHGGRIEFYSSEGEGSEIRVIFPVS